MNYFHRGFMTSQRGGKAIPSTLTGALGWWDVAGYSSGNWANRGTGGSALDFIMGAATAAPAFTGGFFVFDGVNDYMYISDTNALDFGANEAQTIGIICSPTTGIGTAARIFSKDDGTAGANYLLRAATGNLRYNVNDGTQSAQAVGGAFTVETFQLLAGVRDTAGNAATAYINGVPGTPVALTSELAINNTTELRIGGIATAFAAMRVRAAFLTKTALTEAQLVAIARYYGIS